MPSYIWGHQLAMEVKSDGQVIRRTFSAQRVFRKSPSITHSLAKTVLNSFATVHFFGCGYSRFLAPVFSHFLAILVDLPHAHFEFLLG